MSRVRRVVINICILLGCLSCSSNKPKVEPASGETRNNHSEATASHFIVSTQGVGATKAAMTILEEGGNIIDAAVATSFAISVERPHSTGLGGGGFLLYRDAKSKKTYAIDFRERAPLKASRDMYLDSKGEVIPKLSLDGILSVATPGLVAGMIEIHDRFGKLPLERVLRPAIDLAEQGFPVYPTLEEAMTGRKNLLARFPATKAIFLKADGSPYHLGEVLVQKDLGRTLRLIAKLGKKAFYKGELGRRIVAESQSQKGLLTQRDLDSYRVKWRSPVEGTYKGYKIVSMPPPSSGGAHVIEILNIVENDPLKNLGFQSAQGIHHIASAMQLAFADRAKYMGDPDFVSIPLTELSSKEYAKKQHSRISSLRHTPSSEVGPGDFSKQESPSTTHFSMMDADGNAISSTQTINYSFGSGIVVPGTGIILNDEMDDFSAKPGASNIFGAVGGDKNSIAPKKTPLSSMSPTLVFKDEIPMMALGAPGGTRIINCVAQVLLNYLEYSLPLYESVSALRFHHQWQPDTLQIDSPGPASSTLNELKKMGYKVDVDDDAVFCRVMAVAREGDHLHGVADPRDVGTSLGN